MSEALSGTDAKLLPETREFLERPPRMYVGGAWTGAGSGGEMDVIDPATARVIARVPRASKSDIDAAVAAACEAHEDGRWRNLRLSKRTEILFEIGRRIKKDIPRLSQLESLDAGKPIKLASGECYAAGDAFSYYAGWVTKVYGETNPSDGRLFTYTLREPMGVCAGITPWNFPIIMAAWKIAPALAFGNTIVLKPAEQSPLTALALAQICRETGVPEGVVNVVTGEGPEAGAALAAHPDVDKVAFTGSTEVGRSIVEASKRNLKRVTLELGGKSPNIVFPDADMRRAASGSMCGVFVNSGQMCTAGTRILVEEDIHDEFAESLVAATEKMPLGPPLDERTGMGPVISAEQYDRVLGYIQIGREEGAEVATGGGPADEFGEGYFVKPTVFTGVTADMRIAREEIFGPVAAVMPFSDADEAVEIANDTEYGLAAAVWTGNLTTAHRVSRGLKAGTVWINTAGLFDSMVSFGGYKQSGYGRELGAHSVEAYTQVKSVWINMA